MADGIFILFSLSPGREGTDQDTLPECEVFESGDEWIPLLHGLQVQSRRTEPEERTVRSLRLKYLAHTLTKTHASGKINHSQ